MDHMGPQGKSGPTAEIDQTVSCQSMLYSTTNFALQSTIFCSAYSTRYLLLIFLCRERSTSEVFDLQYPHTVLCIVMYKGTSHLLGMPLQLRKELCYTSCVLLLHKHAPAHQTIGLHSVDLRPIAVSALDM